MNAIVKEVKKAIIERIDPQVLASSARYHKAGEAPRVHGVRMGEISKIGKSGFQQIKHLPKQEIFAFCDWLSRRDL